MFESNVKSLNGSKFEFHCAPPRITMCFLSTSRMAFTAAFCTASMRLL